jgi:hypothetical protein
LQRCHGARQWNASADDQPGGGTVVKDASLALLHGTAVFFLRMSAWCWGCHERDWERFWIGQWGGELRLPELRWQRLVLPTQLRCCGRTSNDCRASVGTVTP